MPKLYVKTPNLNNYLYDLCYNLPNEKIKTLPMKYRRILASERSTKNFCEKSTIDEKLHFFNCIGLTNSLTIFPESIKGKNQTKEFFKNYENEKLASAQKDHAILNVHVSCDKQTSHLMGLMAMTIAAKGFRVNLDYNKTAFSLKNWDRQLNSAEANTFSETIESADYTVKTMLNTINSFDRCDSLHEVSPNDIRLLLFMYLERNRYVSKDSIWEYFMTSITKGKVTSCITRLTNFEYLQKHVDWKIPRYTITARGINLVNDFTKRILKLNNF